MLVDLLPKHMHVWFSAMCKVYTLTGNILLLIIKKVRCRDFRWLGDISCTPSAPFVLQQLYCPLPLSCSLDATHLHPTLLPLHHSWPGVESGAEDENQESHGPDSISSRLLRDSAGQLCEVITSIFNLSLNLESVLILWRRSCVVPVPKTTLPKEPNHFRPIVLTSHLMKMLERIILHHIRSFAYQLWENKGLFYSILASVVTRRKTWSPPRAEEPEVQSWNDALRRTDAL